MVGITDELPSFEDDFSGGVDEERWVDHYLPHWTTPGRSRARYRLLRPGLELRIEHDQPDWRDEDAPLRVSNLQTAVFSGPPGSTRGTHRHRPDGLVVRTETPERILWAPRRGRLELTVSASVDPGCMLAAWLVGTEHDSADDSGEICVFEIDAAPEPAATTAARAGVKAHGDPRLRTEMVAVDVPVPTGRVHTWTAGWGADGVTIACEGREVFRTAQVLDYPLQLMLDLFEVGGRDDEGAYPKTAIVHRVRGRG